MLLHAEGSMRQNPAEIPTLLPSTVSCRLDIVTMMNEALNAMEREAVLFHR
jgi:hypothetical protein